MARTQQGLSFFRSIGWFDNKKSDFSTKRKVSPSLKIQLEKATYRPGDSVIASVAVSIPQILNGHPDVEHLSNQASSFLLDHLSLEIKGIEKLDCQWFVAHKPSPGSKHRRGEFLFLDCTAPSIVSKVMISPGRSKTYIVRFELPKVLPPSYRGISIRYIYYVRGTIFGRWLVLENNDHSETSTNELIQVETRVPLQILISQKTNNLLTAEDPNVPEKEKNSVSFLSLGNLPISLDQFDIFWKEKGVDSEWTRANESLDVLEEGYDSSRDEVSSVSSYNPGRGNSELHYPRRSLSLQSIGSRLSNNDFHQFQAERTLGPAYAPITQLSVAEVVDDLGAGAFSPLNKLTDYLSTPSPSRPRSSQEVHDDDSESPHTLKLVEPSTSESIICKSYNIKIDDQALLKFSPNNSDSTYYFGDMIGGTLTFFHGGVWRCLEVVITLEITETISQHFVHPSRRSSPTITKVQSEHHEIAADLDQTSFLFSIPIDGPMSFSTPKVSVQWLLRFEFFITPKDLDLTRYEHPLLVERRDKRDWVIPITVYAPSLRIQPARTTNEKAFSFEYVFNA